MEQAQVRLAEISRHLAAAEQPAAVRSGGRVTPKGPPQGPPIVLGAMVLDVQVKHVSFLIPFKGEPSKYLWSACFAGTIKQRRYRGRWNCARKCAAKPWRGGQKRRSCSRPAQQVRKGYAATRFGTFSFHGSCLHFHLLSAPFEKTPYDETRY